MKKNILMITILFGLSTGAFLGAQETEATSSSAGSSSDLRIYGAFGSTYVSNSLSETYGGDNIDGFKRDIANGGFGLQYVTDIIGNLRLGMETSMWRYINETDDPDKDVHPMAIDNIYCYRGMQLLSIMEFKLSDIYILQSGFGMFTTLGVNNQYGGTAPYFMMAAGADIPVNEKISIPLLLRVSTFESVSGNFNAEGRGFGSIIPVAMVFGVTVKL